MKFLKIIVTDILMIPVIFEIGFKLCKDVDLKDDNNFSVYAKWVLGLLDDTENN